MKNLIFIFRYVEPFRSYVLPIDGSPRKLKFFHRRKGAAAILADILEFTFTSYFFHPENDFNGLLDTQNLGKDTKFITPRQMQVELYWV